MEIQQKPYEWMIKYTPQREWIERRGVLVWIAEAFTSLGAGLYLVSLYFNSLVGMVIAWLIIVALKIPLHVIYFGKPLRFWRTIVPFNNTWRTSWFSRGVTATALFSGIGFIQICLSYWLPGTAWEVGFKVLAGITVFVVGIYSGFIMSYCRSVPLWNSALLPFLFILFGVNDGFALIMAVGLGGGQVDVTAAEAGSRVLLIVCALVIAIYLWNQTYTSTTAKESVLELIRGYLAPVFWIGIIALGIVIPLVISAFSYFTGELTRPLLITAVVFHTLSAFALKYCLLKAGVYQPLLPSMYTMPAATKT